MKQKKQMRRDTSFFVDTLQTLQTMHLILHSSNHFSKKKKNKKSYCCCCCVVWAVSALILNERDNIMDKCCALILEKM